jgi:hypothetical protein
MADADDRETVTVWRGRCDVHGCGAVQELLGVEDEIQAMERLRDSGWKCLTEFRGPATHLICPAHGEDIIEIRASKRT